MTKQKRIIELENTLSLSHSEADYYRVQLAKSHEILGRVVHQLSERWDTVNLTEYYPTDNLSHKRTIGNPTGNKQ